MAFSTPRVRLSIASAVLLALGTGVVVAPPAAAQSAAANGWYGTYEYTETIPRLSGMTATIDYRVTLSDAGCRLDAEGLQTDTHMRCTARMKGKSLQIAFQSYADGGMTNQYGIARYKRGTPLLTFTRTPRGLVTNWQSYTMSDGKRHNGKYFMKRLS